MLETLVWVQQASEIFAGEDIINFDRVEDVLDSKDSILSNEANANNGVFWGRGEL